MNGRVEIVDVRLKTTKVEIVDTELSFVVDERGAIWICLVVQRIRLEHYNSLLVCDWKATTTMSTSNRVGHPVRNRKRNRLIYNEDEETSFGAHTKLTAYTTARPITPPAKQPKISSGHSSSASSAASSSRQASSTDANNNTSQQQYHAPVTTKSSRSGKNNLQQMAARLKSLVKLPKSHNWINYEWFYSSIDQVLFLDQNEYNTCLNDSFPHLKTRCMTRPQWRQIRRLMGKPRRCSKAFFDEERSTLNTRRNKIRFLQQNKVQDLTAYKDLPAMIPQQLTVGTIVCILARQHDHFYYGVIEGIDPSNNTYRINFHSEKPSITVPDYDVVPINKSTLVPLSSFQAKVRNKVGIYAFRDVDIF